MRGEEHPAWKGDEASYHAVHIWLNKQHPRKGVCETCGAEGKTHYAYLGPRGKYERDRSMYLEECPPCHGKRDFGKPDKKETPLARSTSRRTAAESITRFLDGRARPVTAHYIAEKTGINLNTVRTTLGLLDEVEIVGRETPSFGRPANLYKLAA